MKTIGKALVLFISFLFYQHGFAETGSFFNVKTSGNALSIRTTPVNHHYPHAGIRVSPGYIVTGCTPSPSGYCLFSASDTSPTTIKLMGPNGSSDNPVELTLCLNGLAPNPLTCQKPLFLLETFTGQSATLPWITLQSTTDTDRFIACLTAGNANTIGTIPACLPPTDSPNMGVLQLTKPVILQGNGIILPSLLPTNKGLFISFTAYVYGGNGGTGADGISVFLINGNSPLPDHLGFIGGGLGYKGLEGGYVGVGFDEFGNFSSPGFAPNSIVIRGAAPTYTYIAGATPGIPLSQDLVTNRANSIPYYYTISLTPGGLMSVSLNGVTYLSNINIIPASGAVPPRVYFGLAGSSGASTNYHEINSLLITTLN